MCDTFVALGSATEDGAVVFGKNSDREPNEAHEVIQNPAADYPDGARLRCTYIEIPQVSHTYAVLIAKPFWIWGAEMGANEYGVTIGNEAVFTREPYQKKPGLIGMDLLRLGLERGASAEEALHVIIDLIETYGQGGNCGFAHPFYYHNSFLIADLHNAWVLETAGKEWAAEKVRAVRSISNQITISSQWDLASPNLVKNAVDRGWCKNQQDFSFSRCYSDFLYTRFGAAGYRHACTTQLLESHRGGVSSADAMRFLRSHGIGEKSEWRPDPALAGAEVCMHAGFGPVRINQSTGSMVAHLKPGQLDFWVTATSAPCLRIFKPLWMSGEFQWNEPSPQGVFDPACLWWRHERLHRTVLLDYPTRSAVIHPERDSLEYEFLERSGAVPDDRAVRESFMRKCFQNAEAAEKRWFEQAAVLPVNHTNRFYYSRAWAGFNRQARLRV